MLLKKNEERNPRPPHNTTRHSLQRSVSVMMNATQFVQNRPNPLIKYICLYSCLVLWELGLMRGEGGEYPRDHLLINALVASIALPRTSSLSSSYMDPAIYIHATMKARRGARQERGWTRRGKTETEKTRRSTEQCANNTCPYQATKPKCFMYILSDRSSSD